MKTLTKALLALAVFFALFRPGHEAQASGRYFTKAQLLKAFFPKSDKVSFQKFTATKSQMKAITKALGYRPAKNSYYFFVATTGSHIDGYAFIDDQMGQHQPITFGVKLSTTGVVQRQEILVYRESHGEEVRSARFRNQFRGKTVHDALTANKDIDSISGATISSKAITVGVRRSLVLFQAAIAQAPRVSSAR